MQAATGGFPPAAGPNRRGRFFSTRNRQKGGSMASDITLAVGDDARRIAYAELGQLRAVPRPISGNAIATTEFDGSGLAEALSDGTGQETPANGPRPDPGNVGALESAVEGLR